MGRRRHRDRNDSRERRGWRSVKSRRRRIKVGAVEIIAVVAAVFLIISSPLAMGDAAFHRGVQQPGLKLFGQRYEVAYRCPPGVMRRHTAIPGQAPETLYVGARYFHYLAWDHEDAIRFAASLEPRCRVSRLYLVKRPWFGRYIDRQMIVGPET